LDRFVRQFDLSHSLRTIAGPSRLPSDVLHRNRRSCDLAQLRDGFRRRSQLRGGEVLAEVGDRRRAAAREAGDSERPSRNEFETARFSTGHLAPASAALPKIYYVSHNEQFCVT
jgi:hypothetical protein